MGGNYQELTAMAWGCPLQSASLQRSLLLCTSSTLMGARMLPGASWRLCPQLMQSELRL